jgi:predicted N-formylglutamate amidohydrolase
MAEFTGPRNWRFPVSFRMCCRDASQEKDMSFEAYEIFGQDRDSRWLITCDHATNHVPAEVNGGTLGLPEDQMGRHIAYDIGAAGVTRRLAERLGAPAILSTFSRLVIDPNRGEDDPTLVMQLYDGTIVPGNRGISAEDVARRKALCWQPYHDALEGLAARRDDTIIIAIHSFTPRLFGRHPRPWQIGILHAYDGRFAVPLIERLRQEQDLFVGDNEPYPGHLPGDSIDRHALHHGRPNALIELRHDLIADATGQAEWADRLAPILEEVLAHTQL